MSAGWFIFFGVFVSARRIAANIAKLPDLLRASSFVSNFAAADKGAKACLALLAPKLLYVWGL